MVSKKILQLYLNFYEKKGHKLIPNLSLVPEGDSTLLFVNSGMFPLVPYLSGEAHPLGKRLVNIQRSMRFEDLEEVGDNRHTTVFHMLGNWSLGDYSKEEQLNWVYQFYIEELGLDPQKLFASIFAGQGNIAKDNQSLSILKQVFSKYGVNPDENKRIFAYGKDQNWWQRGDALGELGGPDSEIFYYMGKGTGIGKNPQDNPNEFIEIGNSVFMQYKKGPKNWELLPQQNVDFGGGLERLAMVVQNKQDIFQTDNFYPIIQKLESLTNLNYQQDNEVSKSMRILADHLRAATLLAMDGVIPSNKDQGYCLRRLLRRMVRFGKNKLGLENISQSLFPGIIDSIGWLYPNLSSQQKDIINLFTTEETKFTLALKNAQKAVKQALDKNLDKPEKLAETAFNLYQSTGYPPEMFFDDVVIKGTTITPAEFNKSYEQQVSKHQALSRKGAETKFKGGLANQSTQVTKYHTATHLLHSALRIVLGPQVEQRGSNITKDRLRFDFSHSAPLTNDEKQKVEDIVSKQIAKKLPVSFKEMNKQEAEKLGALHFFNTKYPDKVKVYFIGSSLDKAFSKEFCGGPHIANLSEISPIAIYKQESVGKGIRRIYARFTE